MLCSAAACVNPNRKRDAVGVLIGMAIISFSVLMNHSGLSG